MKTISIYEASDGARFDDLDKCGDYERLLAEVQVAMQPLGVRPDDCNFTNGEGYIQHDKADVLKARFALHDLAKAGPLKAWFEDQKSTDYQLAIEVHPGWQMRMLDGTCRPLERAYGRLVCIDDQCREWGQPYYVEHPHEAKMFQRNA